MSARPASDNHPDSPLVSVVIPLFNGEGFIADALRSLQAQDMRGWEAIVIDDGSTDAGAEISRRIGAADPRVRVFSRANAGVGAARNAGLDRARGKYVLFLDADDWLLGGALGRLVEGAEAGTGAAYGGVALHDEGGRSLEFTVETPHGGVGLNELLGGNPFVLHGVLVRREFLGGVRFDGALAASEDWDFWLRVAERGVEWRAVHEAVGAYRLRASSRSRRWRDVAESEATIISDAFERARAGRIDLDLGDDRRAGAIVRRALLAAAAAAASDLDGAIEILRPFAGPGALDAFDAAEAAYWGVPAGLCGSARVWNDESMHPVRAIAAFWNRCRDEGWTEPLFFGRATSRLARCMVDPDEIARLVAEELDSRRPVLLLGFGSNARRLARLLLGGGFAVSARDDAAAEPSVVEIAGASITVNPGSLPIHSGMQCVVTPNDDLGIVSRLPDSVRAIRWSEAREALFARTATRLLLAWPGDGRGVREAA